MKHIALVAFPWSPNGVDVEYLSAGDERDFGGFTQGLKDANLIDVPGNKPADTVSQDDNSAPQTSDESAPAVAMPENIVAETEPVAITEDVAVEETPATIEIPSDWEALPWPRLRSLAAKVAEEGHKISNRDDAKEAIEAYLEKSRATEQPAV